MSDNNIAFEIDLLNDTGSSTNFCPPFWKQPYCDVWKEAAEGKNTQTMVAQPMSVRMDWRLYATLSDMASALMVQ